MVLPQISNYSRVLGPPGPPSNEAPDIRIQRYRSRISDSMTRSAQGVWSFGRFQHRRNLFQSRWEETFPGQLLWISWVMMHG